MTAITFGSDLGLAAGREVGRSMLPTQATLADFKELEHKVLDQADEVDARLISLTARIQRFADNRSKVCRILSELRSINAFYMAKSAADQILDGVDDFIKELENAPIPEYLPKPKKIVARLLLKRSHSRYYDIIKKFSSARSLWKDELERIRLSVAAERSAAMNEISSGEKDLLFIFNEIVERYGLTVLSAKISSDDEPFVTLEIGEVIGERDGNQEGRLICAIKRDVWEISPEMAASVGLELRTVQ